MTRREKTALICGISGQDGAYLAQLLLDEGYRVCGTSRDAQMSGFHNLVKLGIRDRLQLLSMVVAPGGVANPGAQMYHFVTGATDRDERPCNDTCFYKGLVAKGDRAGLVVTGRHRVAEEERQQRQGAAQEFLDGAAGGSRWRWLPVWLRRWLHG